MSSVTPASVDGKPVAGRYLPVIDCSCCGSVVLDYLIISRFTRVMWGEIDHAYIDKNKIKTGSTFKRSLCRKCEKQQEREKYKQEMTGKCILCGSGYQKWSKYGERWQSNYSLSQIKDRVCTGWVCYQRALKACSFKPICINGEKITPSKLFKKASFMDKDKLLLSYALAALINEIQNRGNTKWRITN